MVLLDLFCGAGGAAMGYYRAGFEITGVDHKPQPHYPFEFHQADALEYLKKHGHEFDIIHASPPCQGYSKLAGMHKSKEYPLLIEELRKILKKIGKPYIIENVEQAPLCYCSTLFGSYGVMLCGSMFRLGVKEGYLRRHRIFETSFSVSQPRCRHRGRAVAVYGHGCFTGRHRSLNRRKSAEALQIDWMTHQEMTQAIPPAYTEFIGRQLILYK